MPRIPASLVLPRTPTPSLLASVAPSSLTRALILITGSAGSMPLNRTTGISLASTGTIHSNRLFAGEAVFSMKTSPTADTRQCSPFGSVTV